MTCAVPQKIWFSPIVKRKCEQEIIWLLWARAIFCNFFVTVGAQFLSKFWAQKSSHTGFAMSRFCGARRKRRREKWCLAWRTWNNSCMHGTSFLLPAKQTQKIAVESLEADRGATWNKTLHGQDFCNELKCWLCPVVFNSYLLIIIFYLNV